MIILGASCLGVSVTNTTLLVVSSLLAAESPEWSRVPEALAAKHAHEACVSCVTASPSVTNALGQIRSAQPTHVAFVMRPEEVDFATVVAMKRMMRDVDEDPYDDAVWGIVTGPTADDALRIASSREPAAIHAVLATTGVDDDLIAGPVTCLADSYPVGRWYVKDAAGRVSRHSSSNDISHVFAEVWGRFDPDLLVTSAHASQRNLEMPFSRGNIVPKDGVFATLPRKSLIDYSTGLAKGTPLAAVSSRLAAPGRDKVWIAAGNCLIADNLGGGGNMVMTALGFGRVNQFVGYMTTTWFGEVGWNTWRNFLRGQALVDAYFSANEQLLRELEKSLPEAKDFRPVFGDAADYKRLTREAKAFKPYAKVADKKNTLGRLWDRDATVFYGDPLHKVYLKRPQGRSESEDLDFLLAHQPAAHRGKADGDYLRENVALAREAWNAAPWKAILNEEIFREYVLPYTVIDEEVDRWRPLFRERFRPLVRGCRTVGDAAAILNANVLNMLDVRYDTRRDKANQSPLHSMRIHMASCTGLTILLVDAFRACGIPARLAGCNWTPISGNHSWLEYYDGTAWHFLGDPREDGTSPVDESWFAEYAAMADDSSHRTRVYATRWSPNAANVRFWAAWCGSDAPSAVPADDVTAFYRRFRKSTSLARIAFVARGADGRRVSVPLRVVVSGSGKVVYEGRTFDESHDMNDHVVVEQPSKTKVAVQLRSATGDWRTAKLVEFTDSQGLCALDVRP